MPINHDCPLADIDAFVTRRYGTHFEADIFAMLLSCPSIIRSFEFALADGALFATEGVAPPPGNFTERFWQLNEQIRMKRNSKEHWSRVLVPFDIKSCVGNRAEDQIYITKVGQRARVGFYIAVCAADPNYVELIPNRFSGNSSVELSKRKVAVNVSRKSLLPPSAYGSLSLCNSPYRMPISLLQQALNNMQHCSRGYGDYANPWTGVRFPGWKPHIEHGNDILTPAEDSQHYTSFKGVLEIWRGIRIAKSRSSIQADFELMDLQPRLADFKILVPDIHAHADVGVLVPEVLAQLPRRQVFVQYKIDGLYRSPASPLTKVAIARNQRKGRITHYFTDYEQFDYLFYQFDYQDHQKTAWTQFFFLPESVIPDMFYLTEAKEADFSRDEFKPYWFEMDMGGRWVQQVALRGFKGLLLSFPVRTPSGTTVTAGTSGPLRSRKHFSRMSAFLVPSLNSPKTTTVVPFIVYTKNRESTSRGPTLTAAEFERLDTCPQGRLLVFDLFGQDGSEVYSPLLVIPSHDLSSTEEQCTLFESNRGKDKDEEFEGRVPLLAELLHTGLNPMDYAISAGGPNLFESGMNPWGELWALLDQASGIDDFVYPHASSYPRRPSEYRVTLQELHQQLVDRHALVDIEPSMYEQSSEDDEEVDDEES
ncbi:Nn.00g007460.m01.CDS01 [Neocucurbitaria sp. VM-36]